MDSERLMSWATRSKRMIAVDVGASRIAGGEFTLAVDGSLLLRRFALERLPTNSAQDPDWIRHVGIALPSIASRIGLAGPVVLAVPGHLALTKFIATPSIDKAKREKIIQFEASQTIPYPLEEVVWDHVVIADSGPELAVLLMAVKTEAMEGLCAAAREARLAVACATPACIALHAAFRFQYPEIKDSVLVINIGARSTQVLLIHGDRFFVRTVGFAGHAVTQSVADELGLGFPEAETLKITVLSGGEASPVDARLRAAVEEGARRFCERLTSELVRSALHLRRQGGAGEPTAVYVTGGGSLISELPQILTRGLNIPVTRFDSVKRCAVAPSAAENVMPSMIPMLADLTGLAAGWLMERSTGPNVLPAPERARLASRSRTFAGMASAVLIVGSLVPPLWHCHQVAILAQARLAAVEAELRPMRQLQREIAQREAQLELVRNECAMLERIAETKTSWLWFLAELQDRLTAVEDVWLDRLVVVPASDREPGEASRRNVAPIQLRLSGRLLDRDTPDSATGVTAHARVKRLLVDLSKSRYIAAVSNERFDTRVPGMLRFDLTLTLSRENPL